MNLNVLELQLKCQKLLAQISRSEKLLPGYFVFVLFCFVYFTLFSTFFRSQLIDVLAHVKTTMERKFPNSVYIAFGNFLFLRFISPAIVSPEGFGLANGKQKTKQTNKQTRTYTPNL
jgi:hypothetical protein